MKYSVKYEVEALPSNVIVEVICKSKEEADIEYRARIGCGFKNLKVIKTE
jgi:hypothetical protein